MDKDELASEVMMLRILLSALMEVTADDLDSRTRLTRIICDEIDREANREERRKTLAERIYLRKLKKLGADLTSPNTAERPD